MHDALWMLRQLDYVTRAHHIAVDFSRISLLGAKASREKYVAYLERVYAFEAPVEARWQQMTNLESTIDLQRRLRTGVLASDLRALGSTPATVEPTSFAGIEQALGWMYVVERGRRLNGMLRRHLLRRIPDVIELAGSYLATSSPSGTRWQRLGITLDRIARNHAAAEQVIHAAHRAFRALRTTRPVRDEVRAA